jgi:hypothetical protein
MESPVTLHAKAGQLVTNLVESNLNHAARTAPRRLIAGLAGCPPTKPLGLDTIHRARAARQSFVNKLPLRNLMLCRDGPRAVESSCTSPMITTSVIIFFLADDRERAGATPATVD